MTSKAYRLFERAVTPWPLEIKITQVHLDRLGLPFFEDQIWHKYISCALAHERNAAKEVVLKRVPLVPYSSSSVTKLFKCVALD